MNNTPTYITRKRYGRLHWEKIHRLAIDVKDNRGLMEFNGTMRSISQSYECDLCREHISEYLETVGLPKSPEEAFEWTVVFHNSVNRRLGKQELETKDAYIMYLL